MTQKMEWQPIETAPQDGTRVILWRGFTSLGVWKEMVVGEWHSGAWVWPSEGDNPSTHGEWTEDDLDFGYVDHKSFTHWMPLPEPPEDK